MKNLTKNNMNVRQYNPSAQKGLVLFIALVALVAMSLAAAALIRSVDTSVLVAGNLAFKQSATMSADRAVAAAITYIENNTNNLNNNLPAQGYHATSTGIVNLFDVNTTWTNANSVFATGSGLAANGTDTSGNSIRFLVQRMCRTTGAIDETNCLLGSSSGDGNSKGSGGDNSLDKATIQSTLAVYRVTARVTGPKNTVSYIQAYII